MTAHYPKRAYSIAEASALAGCSRETIRSKIKSKTLVAARIGRGPWRISVESFDEMIAPLKAIEPTIPTVKELNRRVRNLLRP